MISINGQKLYNVGNRISILLDNFRGGTEYITKILKIIKNQFWLDVFNAHIELQSNNQPKEIHEFQESAIFYNKNHKGGKYQYL